jgi:aminomethyltransferase
LAFLEHLTPSDLTLLNPHESTLSTFLHPGTGGIVDDLIITMLNPEDFYVVTNAGCAEKDLAYIRENLAAFERKNEVEHVVLENQGLVALQGPRAQELLNEFLIHALGDTQKVPDLEHFYFGQSMWVDTPAFGKLHIARGGYTGEDGFEISISPETTVEVAKELLRIGKKGNTLKLAGLGARDTLRLEAGMCLYGHDLDDSTTPIEAGLKWLVGKRRIMEA